MQAGSRAHELTPYTVPFFHLGFDRIPLTDACTLKPVSQPATFHPHPLHLSQIQPDWKGGLGRRRPVACRFTPDLDA